MGLKRKRSIDTISPSSSSTTASVDLDNASPIPLSFSMRAIDNDDMMQYCSHPDPSYYNTADSLPKHLHSRTRKRFRNGRPDDEIVHGTRPFPTFDSTGDCSQVSQKIPSSSFMQLNSRTSINSTHILRL